MRLFAVLSTTRALLDRSKEEGWGLEEPREVMQQMDEMIDAIFFEDRRPLPKYWSILFAPTGPLQEISMANGWHDAYLKLSKEYDKLKPILKAHETEQGSGSNPEVS